MKKYLTILLLMSGSFLKCSSYSEITLAHKVEYSKVPVRVSPENQFIVSHTLTEQIQNELPESAIRQPPITLDTNKEYFLMPPSVFSVNRNVLESGANLHICSILRSLFAIRDLQSNNPSNPPSKDIKKGITKWVKVLQTSYLYCTNFAPNITSTSKLNGVLYINPYLCMTSSCNTTNTALEPIYVNFYDSLNSTAPYLTIECIDITLGNGEYVLVSFSNMFNIDIALDRVTQSINEFKQQTHKYKIEAAEQQVQITKSRYEKKSENQISESNTNRLNTVKLEYENAERQLELLTRQYEEAKRLLEAKGLLETLAAKICSMI